MAGVIMRPFYILFACGAIVESASNLAFTDSSWTGIVTGVPFVLSWTGNSGTVNLTLENGTTTDPNDIHSLASDINSNSYSWSPGAFAIPGKTFFISIVDSAGTEAFSPKFTVAATASSTSTTSSASRTSSTASRTSRASSTESTSSPTSTPISAAGSSGLSSGAKAGIGVGVALGVCLIAGLLATAVFWRRRYRAIATNDGSAGSGSNVGLNAVRQTEKKGGWFGFSSRRTGLEKGNAGAGQVHELQAGGEVQELDGTVRAELQ